MEAGFNGVMTASQFPLMADRRGDLPGSDAVKDGTGSHPAPFYYNLSEYGWPLSEHLTGKPMDGDSRRQTNGQAPAGSTTNSKTIIGLKWSNSTAASGLPQTTSSSSPLGATDGAVVGVSGRAAKGGGDSLPSRASTPQSVSSGCSSSVASSHLWSEDMTRLVLPNASGLYNPTGGPFGNFSYEAGSMDLSHDTAVLRVTMEQREILDKINLLKLQQQYDELERVKQDMIAARKQQAELTEQRIMLSGGLPETRSGSPRLASSACGSRQTNDEALLITTANGCSPRLEVTRVRLPAGNSSSNSSEHSSSVGRVSPAGNRSQACRSQASRQPHSLEETVTRNRDELQNCPWYHGRMSWQDSDRLLANTAPGTFLLRDSAHPGCLYSLSIQRGHEEGSRYGGTGPTSIRIQLNNGLFSFDTETPDVFRLMPAFDSVIKLIEYYVSRENGLSKENAAAGKPGSTTSAKKVFDPTGGKVPSCLKVPHAASPVILRQPLLKSPPSLAHTARLSINRSVKSCHPLGGVTKTAPGGVEARDLSAWPHKGLPKNLVEYLQSYPFTV